MNIPGLKKIGQLNRWTVMVGAVLGSTGCEIPTSVDRSQIDGGLGAACGDDDLTGAEVCDDGNTTNGNGCSST